MIAKIELRGGFGDYKYALVDECDYDFIKNYRDGKWYLSHSGKKRYWRAVMDTPDAVNLKIFMHHVILPKKQGFVVDHKDQNALNNQSENLRYATHQQNAWNAGPPHWKLYKGTFSKDNLFYGKLQKEIVGPFETEIEAALAWNELSKKYYGTFGYQNKINI